jgi:hypothetical protein
MARSGSIPRAVEAFVAEHLHAISQLDVLLHLHAAPQEAHTAADVSRALRIPERFVVAQLVDFTAAGVLTMEDGEPPAWRLDDAGPHAAAVDGLAECVRQRRRTVHSLILSGPSDDVHVFSDAFRLRRD